MFKEKSPPLFLRMVANVGALCTLPCLSGGCISAFVALVNMNAYFGYVALGFFLCAVLGGMTWCSLYVAICIIFYYCEQKEPTIEIAGVVEEV